MSDPVRVYVAPLSRFTRGECTRKLVRNGNRRIAVIYHKEHFYAVDNACYHHGGPLLLGDIEEVENHSCIVCPWHQYRIALDTGEGFYMAIGMSASMPSNSDSGNSSRNNSDCTDSRSASQVGVVVAAAQRKEASHNNLLGPVTSLGAHAQVRWRSKGPKQRVHRVVIEHEEVYVEIDIKDGETWESDTYANMGQNPGGLDDSDAGNDEVGALSTPGRDAAGKGREGISWPLHSGLAPRSDHVFQRTGQIPGSSGGGWARSGVNPLTINQPKAALAMCDEYLARRRAITKHASEANHSPHTMCDGEIHTSKDHRRRSTRNRIDAASNIHAGNPIQGPCDEHTRSSKSSPSSSQLGSSEVTATASLSYADPVVSSLVSSSYSLSAPSAVGATGEATDKSTKPKPLVVSCCFARRVCEDVMELRFRYVSGHLYRHVELGEYVELELPLKEDAGRSHDDGCSEFMRRCYTVCGAHENNTLFTLLVKRRRVMPLTADAMTANAQVRQRVLADVSCDVDEESRNARAPRSDDSHPAMKTGCDVSSSNISDSSSSSSSRSTYRYSSPIDTRIDAMQDEQQRRSKKKENENKGSTKRANDASAHARKYGKSDSPYRTDNVSGSVWMYMHALHKPLTVCRVAGSFTMSHHNARIRALGGQVLWLTAGIGITSALAAMKSTLHLDSMLVPSAHEPLHVLHMHTDATLQRIVKLDDLLQWDRNIDAVHGRANRNKSYALRLCLTRAGVHSEHAKDSLPSISSSAAEHVWVQNRRPCGSDVESCVRKHFGQTLFVAFVCGPPSFMSMCMATLCHMGVAECDILTDDT